MLFASLFLVGLAAASPSPAVPQSSWSGMGIATFNDYSYSVKQPSLNCGNISSLPSSIFGAAASNLSPDISGGSCNGTVDDWPCAGQYPSNQNNYKGPQCATNNCGYCYKVTNQGSANLGSTVGGIGQSVVVQIIDACPNTSAWNYCKLEAGVAPSNQTCSDSNTNQLDIDQNAYTNLTGKAFVSGSVPNLIINIEPTSC